MKFKVEQYQLDLGETCIENIFLNQYLSIADGDQIKVYLYALMVAKDPLAKEKMDEAVMSQKLHLSITAIQKAIQYWCQKGLWRRYVDAAGDETYEILSLRQLALGCVSADPNAAINTSYDEAESIQMMADTWKQYAPRIEAVLSLPLTPHEIEKLDTWHRNEGQSKEVITRAFEYLSKNNRPHTVQYTLGTLRNWKIEGILTVEDLEKHLEKEENMIQIRKRKRNYVRQHPTTNKVETPKKFTTDELKKMMQKNLGK